MRQLLPFLFLLLPFAVSAQCPTCGNGILDAGETDVNCPQDAPRSPTCTSPCSQPGSFDPAAGTRQTWDFVGTTTYSQTGLPAGWTFASGPSATTAGTLAAAGTDAYGQKAGLVQPTCSGSCTFTNGFCIGNLANSSSVFSGGSGGKLGANFDGRPNVSQNLSYAVLRGQGSPTLVSPTFNMSSVEGFKVQFWLFPSETSCGQSNSWGSCVGNTSFLDFSTNGGSSWTQVLTMNLSSSSSDMCFNNSSNTLWLNESSWSRVCITVFKSTSSPGNFYTAASSTTAASGIMVNSAYFTSSFKFRVRYSQTASCTGTVSTTNPGRYLAIDYPVVTSGDEMIPCGISFANMCGYGADNNDDGVGSTSTFATTVFGTTRRSPNQAERGVEIFSSQDANFAQQNATGSNFTTNFDLCNAEGGDKQCIDWRSNNNFYNVVYECIADWEAPSGTGINVQYYKGSSPQSFGMTKVTTAGKTAAIGWRYTGFRFVACGSTSDLNPGCNGYSFLSGSLPSQFSRGFYGLAVNSTGQSWTYYGATSCSHYFNGPFFAPIAIPDTLAGSGNYTFCNVTNELVFRGLSTFCSSSAGFSGAASITITGPGGFNETITSGGTGVVPITTPGVYVVTANLPSSPTQCINCSKTACINISAQDISDCNTPVPIDGLEFTAQWWPGEGVDLTWSGLLSQDADYFTVQRAFGSNGWLDLDRIAHNRPDGNYHFLDLNHEIGTRYYRLAIAEPDGNVKYSETLSLELNSDKMLQVFPNPASNEVRVKIALEDQGFTLEIHDLRGRLLHRQDAGTGGSTLDLSNFARGTYLLTVKLNGRSFTERLMVE